MPLSADRARASQADRRSPRESLRLRVFVLIASVNVLVFALGGVFLAQRFTQASEQATREYTDDLVYTLSGTIRGRGELNAARILTWPNWSIVEDALIVDKRLGRSADGRIVPEGLAINPVGRAGRGAEFDADRVLEGLARCLLAGQPLEVSGGRAVPIEGPEGLWGACWYRSRSGSSLGRLLFEIVPWFLLSTALLTAGTYLLLRREVLAPVERLALAARRIEQGELAARVETRAHGAELAGLLTAFNAMASRVEDGQKNLEAKEQQARDEARRAEAAAMTQRRLAAMGELAAGIAHEINNPLGGLQNAVELLTRPHVPAPKREQYLALLRDGLERIGLTVSQLLRFTPRQGERASAGSGSVDLCAVALDALALQRHRAEESGIALLVGIGARRFELDRAQPALELELRRAGSQLPRVRGAQHELGQVILNLLSNALDALEGWQRPAERPARAGLRGSIELLLRVDEKRSELQLVVSDDGPGVPPEILPRVADLFYTTKDVGKGSGLGLPIVHSVLAAHGGRVELASPPGSGFQVTIAVPFA